MKIPLGLVLLLALMATVWWSLAVGAWPAAEAQVARPPGEELLIGHITDEHISPTNTEYYERLVSTLQKLRSTGIDLLLSTGDNTDDNDVASYRRYNQAIAEANRFPITVGSLELWPARGGNIPFRPVAGNHDNYGIYPYSQFFGTERASFTLGNYRFIGFSGNSTQGVPAAWLEEQLRLSCVDGRPIILFHHYPPHGWRPESLDMSAASWATLNDLAQRYPVIAYLAGHNHANRQQAFPPGFVLNTSAGTRTRHSALYMLREGRANVQPITASYAPVVITYPREYHTGLAYTQTRAELLRVRAYVVALEGAIRAVTYTLDGGAPVAMARVGDSSYYEAALDVRALAGEHRLVVRVAHSYGDFAAAAHAIPVAFATEVPERPVPGCECFTPTATAAPPTPTTTPTPTRTATATVTASPTTTPTALPPSATPSRTRPPTVPAPTATAMPTLAVPTPTATPYSLLLPLLQHGG